MQASDLNNMTAQEVFDISAAHLLRQKFRCEDGGGSCRYRGDAPGEMCAVGPFLSDAEAHKYEGRGWADVGGSLGVKKHRTLLLRLQEIHDTVSPERWPRNLAHLAKVTGLKMGQA